MMTQTLSVQGMSCQHCVNSIENALKEIGAEGKVNLSSGTVEVAYDESKLSLDQIKETIEEQGYDIV
ncbi:copper ion binding protein [Paenibacillus tarimensis]|uniref:copper ion binding protein n=1 Tax=Paenibacillus tarimensis TaxID=416012 RepID=UPI001F252E3D|nr:copper ion binding protein [Paenibacillus tarimensis]MCF2945257.1 copper ion binding protein [Paenibacillus tarimensis]